MLKARNNLGASENHKHKRKGSAMTTPICDFVKKYAAADTSRLHMPGHKGKDMLGIEKYDITEVEGADVLYSGDGIIAESERNATRLFGTAKTLYSTGGSSLSIRAMLYLISVFARSKGKRAKILAARNAHKTFLSGLALLDIDVEWLYPDDSGNMLECRVDADALEKYFSAAEQLPTALYVTSPDYLGNISDIEALARVCHKHGVLLAVDNAHGAYLRFLPEDSHPITLGADISCDSAHKTLPVLTGGAYLHIGRCAPAILSEMAEEAMMLFSSTSPSYLIMQSLDMANLYISEGYAEKLKALAQRVDEIKKKLADKGFCLVGQEKIKLTVAPKSYGYTGDQLAKILTEQNIVCEFCDRDFLVLMLTPEIDDCELLRLESLLLSLPRREAIDEKAPAPTKAERATSIREAMLSPSKEIEVKDARGKILAQASVSCPPAIPILVSGERIDGGAIACFEYYGIEKVRVKV